MSSRELLDIQFAAMSLLALLDIRQVSSVEKLLGVTISNTLCWDAHIEQLIKKCNSYLFLLSGIKVFLSRRNRIQFYNSYIYLILISVVLSGVTVVLHWKINL